MQYKEGEIGKRPWGYWRVDEIGKGFIKKTIVVNAEASLSLQSHKHRSEKWEITSGIAEVRVNDNVSILKSHEIVEIPAHAIHRLKNIGKEPLVVQEIQFGEILDEDDIERYEDLYGRCANNNSMSVIFLADMDGTLTPARLPMTESFTIFFEKFISDKIFYIVSGSDYKKILEQLSESVLHGAAGIYASMGNEFFVRGNLIYKNDFSPEESLLEKLEYYRSSTNYPFEFYPNYIEKRCCMINFSILGRNCPHKARAKYNAWDNKNREREKIVQELSKIYPHYDISIGGKISIDIVPRGFGKEQVADQLRNTYKTEKIVFFGDRIGEGGNDYALAQRLSILGNTEIIAVDGPDDVIKILKERYE
ncbi:MAG: HAD-IIB family hydrolase [Clostridiales Family XIII bacterium]|jgi:HAD superfamily hydrolase (TIGR01484 family)|nr:HAD-IIB family hydrolase [Clostridiales Family XIII bacterium]